ncbi:hypothetical protein [Chryseobacterium bernardetii]|uniref:hypothetical protein n=1 Tax=Chryseobacterium bernardetii TaxID=1241978 RepID=UPI001627B712|nr:hypothetical protein [Chryseobacterium bernardetii]
MDRNYFLSYSQIAFLLLLSTVGKLNAKIISAPSSKPELLYYAGVKSTDPSPYSSFSDTFLQHCINTIGYGLNYHSKANDYSYRIVLERFIQYHLPIVNDWNFFLLSMKDLKSVPVWYKWRIFDSVSHTDVLSVIKQVKIFYINSVKLIDGFKFIIKIPDKLNIA